ncbi:putative lectin family integral membrane [Diplodia seriata]|uniref:Putative lectin family integral membrane n=1 Tax=Diplodia seriata TaxID=420778 RepID=A0A0G2EW88_9PEZI|nr:putative lectin family integral membrane [Diplodia seriata]
MHISRQFQSLAWAALAVSSAQAVSIIDNLSFGHKDTISPDRTTIPGWAVSGEGHDPQILSDRVILTPPYPGNKRGQVWAQSPIDKNEFVADVEFRASGQDRGNGNLQIWLTNGGTPAGGVSSLYTAGPFDGLVLSIDQYGGHGGEIRGFLNDGTKSFKDHHNVDSLAFGHCPYPFRNRGIPSRLKITQTGNNFAVEVDDKTCFSTNKDQFNDLNGRVQGINKRVDDIYNLLQEMKTRHEQTHNELMSLNKNGPIHDHVGAVESKVGKIEGMLLAVQKDLEGKDYSGHLTKLQSALKDTHAGLQDSFSDAVTRHAPQMWTFVFLIVIAQVLMFGGYLVYKRRRDSAPKKYL